MFLSPVLHLQYTENCIQQCQYFYLVNDRLYTEHGFGTNQFNSELVFDINSLLILHVLKLVCLQLYVESVIDDIVNYDIKMHCNIVELKTFFFV